MVCHVQDGDWQMQNIEFHNQWYVIDRNTILVKYYFSDVRS